MKELPRNQQTKRVKGPDQKATANRKERVKRKIQEKVESRALRAKRHQQTKAKTKGEDHRVKVRANQKVKNHQVDPEKVKIDRQQKVLPEVKARKRMFSNQIKKRAAKKSEEQELLLKLSRMERSLLKA